MTKLRAFRQTNCCFDSDVLGTQVELMLLALWLVFMQMAKFSPGVGEVLMGLFRMMDILLVDNWYVRRSPIICIADHIKFVQWEYIHFANVIVTSLSIME